MIKTLCRYKRKPFFTPTGQFPYRKCRLPCQLRSQSETEAEEGARNIKNTAAVAVTFSEAMDPESVTGTALCLSLEGTDIEGDVAYDELTCTLTFTPLHPLGHARRYTARLSSAVTDTAGNALAEERAWAFTVEIEPGMWAWMSGPSSANQSGVYGTKGIASESNVPGARAQSVSWADSQGNFWFFGGYYDSDTYFNDLWRYRPVYP